MTASVLNRDWMIQASCRGRDPTWWFPHNKNADAAKRAVRFCAECPVLAECARYAEVIDAHYGIWAGKYHHELAGYRRPDQQLKPCGTIAAYRRHGRRGEPACDRCKEARAVSIAERKRQRA